MTPANPAKALQQTDIMTLLESTAGWRLVGEGSTQAIEKTFEFADYGQTMSFANAVAFIAHTMDHHPDMTVGFKNCTVRYSTHDVGGLSAADFAAAARVNALLGTG